MSHDLAQVSKSLAALDAYARFNKLGGYEPYPFQKVYHACKAGRWQEGKWTGLGGDANQVLNLAANRVGKSVAGYAEDAMHLTGQYPEGWEGPDLTELLRKFPLVWVGGADNLSVRDIGQAELFGNPHNPEAWGTGWIPRDCLPERDDSKRVIRKAGVPNAIDSCQVWHKAGFWVTCACKSYDADVLSWAGRPVGLIHLDEEPPQHIYTQCMARTLDTGGYVKMTFTPEKGMTPVVAQFMSELKPGQLLLIVGWDDVKHPDGRSHLDEKRKAQLLAAFPPHERLMRSKGIPVFGAGLVFYVAEERYMVKRADEFPIPDHWPRIVGLDFGRGGDNHPTAAAWWAFDKEAKVAYLYDCYKSKALEPAVHAAAVKVKGQWIPCAWPHDGHRKESYATEGVAKAYKTLGLRMLPEHFDNSVWSDDKGNAVEPGIFAMNQAMDEGRIKVFERCTDWWQEARTYHRSEKDGSVMPINDDAISASRIGYLSEKRAVPADNDRRIILRPMVAAGTLTMDNLAEHL